MLVSHYNLLQLQLSIVEFGESLKAYKVMIHKLSALYLLQTCHHKVSQLMPILIWAFLLKIYDSNMYWSSITLWLPLLFILIVYAKLLML